MFGRKPKEPEEQDYSRTVEWYISRYGVLLHGFTYYMDWDNVDCWRYITKTTVKSRNHVSEYYNKSLAEITSLLREFQIPEDPIICLARKKVETAPKYVIPNTFGEILCDKGHWHDITKLTIEEFAKIVNWHQSELKRLEENK